MKKLVAVVIPLGKNKKLNFLEKISLLQVHKILKRYPKIFIASQDLDFDFGETYSGYQTERFDDCYFGSLRAHSKLLLSEEFYSRFINYEYVLIYHLDAFVFSDELIKFCQMDFDYIGSPVSKFMGGWHELGCYVGNGGFSLRRVKTFLNILKEHKNILIQSSYSQLFYENEDIFWGYCSTQKILRFKVPQINVALKFSIEYNVGHCYGKLRECLPFGTHGWYKGNFHVWKDFIKQYGYDIERIEKNVKPWETWAVKKTKVGLLVDYIVCRVKKNKATSKAILAQIFNEKAVYTLWGMGADGERCFELMNLGSIKIVSLLDNGENFEKRSRGYSIQKPIHSELLKKKSIIIVTTHKYEKEISELLTGLGLIINQDFLLFSKIEEVFFRKYISKLYNKKY